MADSSRRRRRMPHPTVVPAFVVLASTAAATTPAASGGPAAMAPPPRRPTAAFASSASGNRSGGPEGSGGRRRADDGDDVGLGFEGNTAGVMRSHGDPPGAAAAAGRRRRSLALLSSRLGSSSGNSSRLCFAAEVPRLAGGQMKIRWRKVGASSSSEVQKRRGLFEWGVVATSTSWRLGSSTTSRAGSNDTTPSSNPDTWRHRSERPPAVSSDADGSGAADTAAAAAAAYSALCPALHGWSFPEVVKPPPSQEQEGREQERERECPPPAGRRGGAAEVETKAPERGTLPTADATGVASAADSPGVRAATAVLTVEGDGQEDLSGSRLAAPGAPPPLPPPPSRLGAATGTFGRVRFDVAASAEGGSGGVTGGAGRVDPGEGGRAAVSTGGGRSGDSGSGGGGTGGGGRGGKRATRKRPRGGGVATFESAEDRALRQLLLEATKSGRGGVALRALRLMVEENLPVSQKQYVGAMEACMRQGSWTSGLEVFRLLLEDLRPRGLSPKQSTWRSLARGLRSVGQADQALVVLRQALRAGVGGIDEQVCSILLDLCAVKGRMGLAEEIASLMETHRIPKGPVTYCVLLKGYGRQRRLGGVESTMREMKERGIVPDVVALNAAIDAFVRCGELSKARSVLRSMEEFPGGSIAQTLSYNTLIKGLGRELLVDEAFGVARGMLDKGCLPDEVTTNSLVDICVRSGNLDRAYNLLKNPTLFPPPPPPQPGRDAGLATAAAEARAEAGGVEGMSPGGERREAGLVRPSVEAFTSVLTGFAGVGDKDRALAVFQQMVTAGVEPNVVTYTGLISACVNAGDMDGARRLFSALEARGAETPAMQPSAFTYNTLIRGLCRMGNDTPAVRDTGVVEPEEDMDMDIGIFADEDLLPSPDGGSGGEGRSAVMATRPGGYFYERGTSSSSSPPSKDPKSSMKDPTGKKADGSSKGLAAKDRTVEKTDGSFEDPNSSPAGKETGGAPGPSSRDDEETVASFSSRGGGGDGDEASPGVESPPEILPASYAGSGSSSSSSSDSVNGGAIPEGIQEALRVLLSMRRRGVPADEVTMNSIIDGLVSCSPPRVQEAETLLKLMTGWGLKPNQVSFTVMLKGYGRIGDLGAAELMFEVMAADRDQRPDVVALNSILDACVRNGDLRRAVEILEQASAAALSRRPIFVRHQDWVSSSSTRRPWGGGAGDGAVAICAAAAPDSGIGVDMRDERERVQQGGSAGVTGLGRGRGRDEGVVVDVWPNQVSFATVVLGLSRRGDAPAGRMAIKLYESMRRDFKIVPDEGMVDNLIMACCNAQAGEMDGSDLALAQGQEALNDLRDLGWNEELIAFKEQMLMRVVPTLSEVWKEEDPKEQSQEARQAARLQQQQQQQRTGGKAGASRKRKVSAEIFEKYGWNKMESHFPIL